MAKTKNEDLAFTIVIFKYLKTISVGREEELKLLYSKATRYLKQEAGKAGVELNEVL